MKMNKLQGLIATYKCSASTLNEQNASYEKVIQMIRKHFGLNGRLLASNLFFLMADGELWFTSVQKDPKAPIQISKTLEYAQKLGIKCNTVDYGFGGKSIIKL